MARAFTRTILGARILIACLPLLGVGCRCGADRAPTTAPTPSPDEAARDEARWAAAVVPDLSPVTPATRVEVTGARIVVDNHALVGTWPSRDVERARGASPSGATDWPRVHEELDAPPLGDQLDLPALRAVLARTRAAERAATGAGHGASVFNLHVAVDVPYAQVERVVYTAALAGYTAPRLVLDAGRTERVLPWPRASPRALGQEERRALTEASAAEPGEGAEAPPPPPSLEARLVLGPDAIHALLGGERQSATCATAGADGAELTLLGDAPHEAIGRCLDRLARRADGDTLTLTVDGALPFGRLAEVLQHAVRAFGAVRVLRTPN